MGGGEQRFPGWLGIGDFLQPGSGASSETGGVSCSGTPGVGAIMCSAIGGISSPDPGVMSGSVCFAFALVLVLVGVQCFLLDPFHPTLTY